MRPCRSCGAPIEFVRTVAGKSMPLDVDRGSGGLVDVGPGPGHGRVVEAEPAQGSLLASSEATFRVALDDEVIEEGPVFRAHFATCPSWSR